MSGSAIDRSARSARSSDATLCSRSRCATPVHALPAQAGPPPLLQARGLCLRAPGVTSDAPLHGPCDLQLPAGEQVALLGPSGAGKSTLLRALAGELAPAAGQLAFDGTALQALDRLALARRRAVLPQSHQVAFGLPVALVVGLGRSPWMAAGRAPDDDDPVIGDALALAEAGHLRHRRFDTLSGGEQARVQLARVFAQLWTVRGGLLLVDEPLAALDPGLQFALLDALQAYCRARGHGLLAVLHDINQAFDGFDRLWLMRPGGRLDMQPADARALPALQALYGIRLEAVARPGGGLGVVAGRAAPLAAGRG